MMSVFFFVVSPAVAFCCFGVKHAKNKENKATLVCFTNVYIKHNDCFILFSVFCMFAQEFSLNTQLC